MRESSINVKSVVDPRSIFMVEESLVENTVAVVIIVNITNRNLSVKTEKDLDLCLQKTEVLL